MALLVQCLENLPFGAVEFGWWMSVNAFQQPRCL